MVSCHCPMLFAPFIPQSEISNPQSKDFHFRIQICLLTSALRLLSSDLRIYIPNTLHPKVTMAVATIMATIDVTTAEVAASPTADALRPH